MHVSFAASKSLVVFFVTTALALRRRDDPVDSSTAEDCTYYLTARDSSWNCARFESEGSISHENFVAWNPSVKNDCSGIVLGNAYCVEVNYGLDANTVTTTTTDEMTPTVRRPGPPSNGIPTPLPTQPGMVDNCIKFHYIAPGNTCSQIISQNSVTLEDFAKWNPGIGADCTGMWSKAYACVGIASFALESRYRNDCTGDIHNKVAMKGSEGYCMDTDCQVGSLDIAVDGPCPDGDLQISYWENPGCSGKWYGYGYANKGTCRKLWTDGWKFKAIHLRCARKSEDCSSTGTCTYDPEPEQNVC